MAKVFIDGRAGTTGLRIYERLAGREDISLIRLDEQDRKDPQARKAALQEADIAFLCLPDASAIEAVELAGKSKVAIIDTSTAHRTAEGWTYGFPELSGQRERLKDAARIANPGCHATGFISLVRPLVERGLLSADAVLTCFSLTGYSGGGKKMIAEYTSKTRSPLLDAPRQYGLGQGHKHLPEMRAVCGLDSEPLFCPIVGDFYSGMEVTVPIPASMVKGGIEAVRDCYRDYYSGGLVRFRACDAEDPEGGFLSAAAFSGRDDMEITVCGNSERILLISRFDNLGKGASGAAIQNMNILLGTDEAKGLNVSEN